MSSDKEKNEPIKGHSYDGIEELDNSLPRWWLMTFYITIVFSVIYYAIYQIGNGQTIQQEFDSDVASVESMKQSTSVSAFPLAEKIAEFEKKSDLKAFATPIYQSKCLSCHGDKGQGGIGPNLTDQYWLHGDGTALEISKVIYNGVLDKGMPNWGAILKEDEVYALAVFVQSLKGTSPPGAKAPQGELIK